MLGCPECGQEASFTLLIEGWQENAVFEMGRDGEPVLNQASTVHVKAYDEDELRCGECGEIVAQEDLIEVGE